MYEAAAVEPGPASGHDLVLPCRYTKLVLKGMERVELIIKVMAE